jgi:subtilisin family serine protease
MSEQPSATSFWRGGERLEVRRVPDRFSARMRRGVGPQAVEAAAAATHRRTLGQQNLEEFSADPGSRDEAMDTLRRGDDVEFASHVYQPVGEPTARLYLSGEITVRFSAGAADADVETIAGAHGLQLVEPVRGLPGAYVFRLTAQAAENPIKVANRLAGHAFVETAEPDVVVAVAPAYVPADPRFADQWHLHHDGGPFLTPGSHLDCPGAWDRTRGVRSVVVAVIDDAFDLGHPDLAGEDKIVAPRDFADRDTEPLPGTGDWHGTACAGVAVAEENGHGTVGVAPGCALMPVRMGAYLDDRTVEDMFDWAADRGAAVISCSWSAAAINFPLSLRMRAALRRAAVEGRGGRGCVVVFAAGNANRPVDGTVDEQGWPGDRPSGPTRWHNGFAASPDVVAVSACTSLARKAAYSNWGDEISVCASSSNGHPGVATGITHPRITDPLPGRAIVTADVRGPGGYDAGDYTTTFGGTSSACPAVAGVAALVLSIAPDLTAAEVKELLESTADQIVDPDPDPQLGLTLGTYADGRSGWFGHGKVNADRAVAVAADRSAPGAGAATPRATRSACWPLPAAAPASGSSLRP